MDFYFFLYIKMIIEDEKDILKFVENSQNTYTISIFDSKNKNMDVIKGIINKKVKVIYEKEIEFTELGCLNYIITIYRYEKWIGSRENEWNRAKQDVPRRFKKSRFLKMFIVSADNLSQVVECKKEIREIYKEGNYPVHANDTHSETWDIVSTLVNKKSLDFLNNVKYPCYENFNNMMCEFKGLIPINMRSDICVSSSAVMSLYGLRDCKDFDFLTLNQTYIKYKSSRLSSHESVLNFYEPDKKEIIYNDQYHFYFCGVKFSTLEIVKNHKINRLKHLRNDNTKDKKDIQLINSLLLN
jgi:hypothetical protein